MKQTSTKREKRKNIQNSLKGFGVEDTPLVVDSIFEQIDRTLRVRSHHDSFGTTQTQTQTIPSSPKSKNTNAQSQLARDKSQPSLLDSTPNSPRKKRNSIHL